MDPSSPRLLVVDDIQENREVLARRLSRHGYVVEAAGSGPEALERLEASEYDVILLDVMMPDMDGLEVLRRIREKATPSRLPVVMVTARTTSDDIVEALGLGANDYLTKPVDMPVARARLDAQIARKRSDDEANRARRDLENTNEELADAIAAAQAAAAAKSVFLANMSHEVRTPLNGIVGVVGLLKEICRGEKQQELIAIVEASAAILHRLLSDVLDLARVEAGRLEIRREPFRLAEAVANVGALFEPNALAKSLSLTVETPPDCDVTVIGDAMRIQQILSNLLSNAIKFTAEGGVSLAVRREGDAFAFEIADSGIGFEPEVGAQLFGRFEQGDGSITRRFGGSGLGLAISKELANLMSGDLSATSTLGKGSRFTLTLPLPEATEAEADPAGAAAPRQDGAALDSIRVLVADDNETNRRVLELILDQTGADLTLVENGLLAVQAVEAAPFDLIIMDIQMPVMDGLEAIRRIRDLEQTSGRGRAPILALSANAMAADVERSHGAGADRHLAKPVEAGGLLAALSEALDAAAAEGEAPAAKTA